MKKLLGIVVLGLLLSLNISQIFAHEETTNLTSSEQDILKKQLFNCWSVPLGLPKNKDLKVKVKLMLRSDGTVLNAEVLPHENVNKKFYKVLTNSVLKAIRACEPLKVPPTATGGWRYLTLNFDANEMLED